MNNLNLKFAAQKMTKEQMKNVKGGEDVTGCGLTGGGSFQGFLMCTDDVCTCQAYYDAWCLSTDSCDDVDCGCK